MTDILLPGKRLQSARQSLSMSEQDVARKLHLSVTVVRALESDDYERLPEPAFVKGYIRNYARLVGVPGDEVANLYQQIAAEEQQAPLASTSPSLESAKEKPVWIYAAAVVVIIALIWLVMQDKQEPAAELTPSESVEAVPTEEVPEATIDALEEDSAVLAEPQAEAMAEPAETAPAEADEPSPPALSRLSMRFLEACWLRVVDANGEEIYSGQKPADSKFYIQGEAPFRITLGNAAAVAEIDVNGVTVPVPVSTPGRVVTVRTP